MTPGEYLALSPDEQAQVTCFPWPTFTCYPHKPWQLVDLISGETMRMGTPIGDMPPRWSSPEAAMKAGDRWLKRVSDGK